MVLPIAKTAIQRILEYELPTSRPIFGSADVQHGPNHREVVLPCKAKVIYPIQRGTKSNQQFVHFGNPVICTIGSVVGVEFLGVEPLVEPLCLDLEVGHASHSLVKSLCLCLISTLDELAESTAIFCRACRFNR